MFIANRRVRFAKKNQKWGNNRRGDTGFCNFSLKTNVVKKGAEKEENRYNLSSEFVVSNKTDEKIGIKYMNMSEKIRTIYEHTGEIVSCQDPVVLNYKNNSCAAFVQYLVSSRVKNEMIKRLGPDWKQKIEQLIADFI